MKEPIQLGPASRGTSPCNGAWSLARGQLGVGGLGSRGERQRARYSWALTPKPQGWRRAHLGGTVGKELLLLEPPDRWEA